MFSRIAPRIFLALLCALSVFACTHKSFEERQNLPMPPVGDSGVVEGTYVQTDYGFGLPLPAKWLAFAAGEDWDELVRLSDPDRRMNAGLFARWLYENEKFRLNDWLIEIEKAYEKEGTQAKRGEKTVTWSVPGGYQWQVVTYELKDAVNREWVDRLCVLRRDDLLIWSRARTLKKDAVRADTPKLVEALKESFSKIHWYLPVGSRGISLENYELKKFTQGFTEGVESRSSVRLTRYFDDACPGRERWLVWYRDFVKEGPKGSPAVSKDSRRTPERSKNSSDAVTIQTELEGMIIQGRSATVAFRLFRKEGAESTEAHQAFRLSKAEGSWKIVELISKEEK